MKINRNNYELYFIDYLDGNLSDRDISMLEDFLLLNPDLRAELEGTEKISLSPESIIFTEKENLKKPDLLLPVTENNFEDFCIARSEGDLDEHQLSELEKYTSYHPGSDKIAALYHHLKLIPDKTLVYPGKGELKKTIFFIPAEHFTPVLSVAAAIILMVIVFFSNEDIRKDIPGMTANLPAASVKTADPVEIVSVSDSNMVSLKKKEISQAAVLAISTPQAKKQSAGFKKDQPEKKKGEENKNKNEIPPQRLNPSIEIKLPYISDYKADIPAIDGKKITYHKEPIIENTPEYLSLSEYARRQLMEKTFGDKSVSETKLSKWQIADAGISGFNKLTGGNLKLEKSLASDGSITSYSFESKLLSFSTTAVK